MKKKNRLPKGSWDSAEFSASAQPTNKDANDSTYNISMGPRLLTYDFVVRSLRRRLWKAFQEDDLMTATRAYQATLPDFVRWLEEEEREMRALEHGDETKLSRREITKRQSRSISPVRDVVGIAHTRRLSFERESSDRKPRRKSSRRHGRRRMETEENYQFESKNYRYELIKRQHQQRIETESTIGGPGISILQTRINPSDPFIADDFLSPYDDLTYDNPARKTLPDPVRHAAEQRAMEEERKRRRKAKGPRTAFRRMIFGKRSDRPVIGIGSPRSSRGSHSDFDLVDSMIMDALNNQFNSSDLELNDRDQEDHFMTTPLHEAARLGAGDFVRLMLAHGGDPNMKNGNYQTAIHLCAGGYTVEEKNLVAVAEAAMAAQNEAEDESGPSSGELATHDKKKKKRFRKNSKQRSVIRPTIEASSTAASAIGIPSLIIPNESLELMRQLDSDTLETNKDQKKSTSKSKNKRSVLEKVLSFRSRKNKTDEKSSLETKSSFELLSSSSSRRNLWQKPTRPDPERFNELTLDRLEAMSALLSFEHRESGEGPSINAVDHNGRTSLHYAAELGRSGICSVMLSHFGIMLTIVDEMGTRTPCEIAADQGHTALAALLEARALLYIDPYGLDDEMMDMITAAGDGASGNASGAYRRRNPNGRLVPPYRWFITLSKEEIGQERMDLLEEAKEKLIDEIIDSPCLENNEDDSNLTTRNNSLYGPRQSALEPYVSPSATNENQSKPPPSSGNQDASESDNDDKKPPASDDQETTQNSIDDECFLNLQESQIEQYMTFHKWDLKAALAAFQKSREEAFTAAGMQNIFDGRKEERNFESNTNERLCPICYDEIEEEDWMILKNCGCGFSKECLIDYAKECAKNKTPVHQVKCPDHSCSSGIAKDDLQSLLEKDQSEVLARILEASTDSFITSHSNFRFCPHPGCSGVVHRFRQPKWASADYDETILNYTGAICTAVTTTTEKIGKECTLTYEGVEDENYSNCRSLKQPVKAHRFCFSCGEGVHWPLTCERLEEWKERISDEIGKVDNENGESDFNELAQKIWLKTNTRPCPKCQVPIEKNDGCNHMVCHSCHHEFCWICRQDWKLHSTDTGGFFRCNIWKEDDPDRILDKEDGEIDEVVLDSTNNSNMGLFEDMMNEHGYGSSMHTARKAWKKKQEIKRFLHHYSKWDAHKESSELEQKMADTVCVRLAPVVDAAIEFDGSPSFNFGGKGLSFIHNAFFELAECRSTLRYSYAFSFYRYPSKSFSKPSKSPPLSYLGSKKKEKFRFERLQTELETLTEQMSDIVARSHLRASQVQITYLTAGAAEKRLELNNFVFQIYREEKREAIRQKKRELEKDADEKRKKLPISGRYHNQNRDSEPSSNQDLINRLMQIRDHRHDQSRPYVTMGGLPLNARDFSMQLMAQDQRLLAVGERLRGMEALLRRAQNRNLQEADENEGARFVYIREDDHEGNDDDSHYQRQRPATQMWDCHLCTYMNTGGFYCAMCETPRRYS